MIVESAGQARGDTGGRLWAKLLLLAGLSSPTLATSGIGILIGRLPGFDVLADVAIGVLPMSSLLGLAVVAYAGLFAADLARSGIPKWAARTAVLTVVLGGLLQCGVAFALMTPGLVELP